MNLVDLVKGQLGGSTLSQLAGVVGMDSDDAQRATDAAAPGLLAALSGVASTPDGARRLDAAVEQADSPRDSIAGLLTGGGAALEKSGSMLSSLLGGGNAMSGFSAIIAKFTGLGSGTCAALLGAIAPMILGVLKGQKQSLGLDASGLAGLLNSQKSNIAQALPPGLGTMLGGAGIPGLGAISDWAKGATSRATDAARDVGEGARQYANSAYDSGRDALSGAGRAAHAGASSASRWVIPVLALLVLGGLAWWLISSASRSKPPQAINDAANRTANAVKDTANKTVDATKDAANRTADGVANTADAARNSADATLASAKTAASDAIGKFNTQASDAFDSVTTSLGKVTDASSADEVIPTLKALPDKLDAIQSTLSAAPADSRASYIDKLRPYAQKLNAALDKAMSIPGVADKIRPYVQPVKDKLNALVPPAA
jgi:hypothetical protein